MRFDDLDSEDRSEVLRTYLNEVAPTLATYEDDVQTGIREGVTLYEHLMNGALFIGSILPGLGFDEEEVRILLAAFTLHDANKMVGDDRSLAKVSVSTDFDRLWEEHRLGALVPSSRRELVRSLVVNTSYKHGKTADLLLGGSGSLGALTRLRPAMTAADIHDLSPSFDETRQKQRLCEHLREATGRPLVLTCHRIDEDLGALSALAHSAAAKVMAAHGATEVWVYPEGSWYLADEEPRIEAGELRAAWIAAREDVLGGGIGRFVDTNAKDGFKISPHALVQWQDDEITAEVADYIRGKRAESVLKTVNKRSAGKELPPGCRWPATEREIVPGRIWLAAENLLKACPPSRERPSVILSERLFEEFPAIREPFLSVFEVAKSLRLHPIQELPYALMASIPEAERVAERAFEVAASLVRAKGGFQVGEEQLAPEVVDWLASVRFGAASTDVREEARKALSFYVQGQRSSLGIARGPVEDLTANLVPKGTRVTQFSNRLPAGNREPKRQRDALQGEALRIQTKVATIAATAPLYVHVRPRKGPTPAGWHAAAGALARRLGDGEESALIWQLRHEAGAMVPTFHQGWTGVVPIQRRALHGNGFTLPWQPNSKATDLDDWIDAASTATAIAAELDVDVVLSGQPIAPRPAYRLTFVGVPVLARWIFPEHVGNDVLDAFRGRLHALHEIARRHPGKNWDTAAVLARAGSRGLLALLAAFDRRADTSDKRRVGARDLKLLLTLYPETLMTRNEQAIFSALSRMAALADGHLKTSGFERNDLARPLNELFKALRRTRADDDLELALAVAEDRIFEAKATDARKSGREVGAPTRQATAEFVAHARDLAAAYGSLARLRADERVLRSAFITLVRREFDRRRANQTPQE